jgi:hypothetical protein
MANLFATITVHWMAFLTLYAREAGGCTAACRGEAAGWWCEVGCGGREGGSGCPGGLCVLSVGEAGLRGGSGYPARALAIVGVWRECPVV